MTTATVDHALARLDGIVERAMEAGSRLGYFAVVYRTVTARVKDGLAADFFDDAERMDRLTVAFADLYFEALDAFEARGSPSRSWQVAFAAATRWRPLILQHVLAGMNAHINLDLGIATARTAPGDALAGLRRDFDRINELLALQIDELQGRIAAVSPWIRLLSSLRGRDDDVVIRFSLTVARTQAWRFATELAPIPSAEWAGAVRARDVAIARLGRAVLNPGLPLSTGLLAVRLREQGDVRRNLEVLAGVPAPALATVEARVRDERPD